MFEPMTLVYILLVAALVAAFLRLARGPSLPDRVIAVDLIGVIVVGFVAAYSIDVGRSELVDAALVVALVGFLGTVAFAQYVERRARND